MMYTILVRLDGSSFGEHVLPLALDVARRSGAVLQLVHVHAADAQRPADGALAAQQRECERTYLSSVADRLASAWDGIIATTLRTVGVRSRVPGWGVSWIS